MAIEHVGTGGPDRWQSIEETAREAWRRLDYRGAADVALRAYGNEIYGFLLAQFHGKPGAADDCFSDFSEDFWRGLPQFQWRCSIRAWSYKLARSACSRYRRSPHNRADRRAPGSAGALLAEIGQQARSTTQIHLQTEVKDKIRELREQLSEADRDLLTLRIDRELSWRDVVFAMNTGDDSPADGELHRLEAAIRQRFSEVKRHLKQLAQTAGLL